MQKIDLAAVLRHYVATGQACPAEVLLEAAEALAGQAPKRRPRRKPEAETQDFAFSAETRHKME